MVEQQRPGGPPGRKEGGPDTSPDRQQPQQTTTATITDQAVACGEHGWHVFPCGGRDNPKRPRDGWRWAEWNTTDPAKIRQWLAGTDVYGIACGPSGLVVVDLDMPKPGYRLPAGWAAEPGVVDGKDVFAVLCELAAADWPDTYSVMTPSGGWHLYFTADPARKITVSVGDNGGIAPMIDIRGTGGYVVAPGSVIGGQIYETFNDTDVQPLPEWLANLCERAAPPPAARQPPGQPASHAGYLRAALDGEAAAVASAPEGSRNSQLNKSAYKLARFGELDTGTITAELTDAGQRAGLPDTEIQRTLRSVFTAWGRQ